MANLSLINKKPFSNYPFNTNLPSLPNSIRDYSHKVENNIYKLKGIYYPRNNHYNNSQPKLLSSPRISSRHVKNNSEHITLTHLKEDVFLRLSVKKDKMNKMRESMKLKETLNSKRTETDKNNNSKNNTILNLTDKNKSRSRNLTIDLLSNYDSNSINQYFLTSLNNLSEDAVDEIDNLKYEKRKKKRYNKKMISKCNKKLKNFNNKLIINTDEFIIEKFKPGKNSFNKYFDNLIVGDKNFDIKAMINILKERNKSKNKFLHEIQFKKIEQKHKDFMKMIENNQIDVKELRKNYDKILQKK